MATDVRQATTRRRWRRRLRLTSWGGLLAALIAFGVILLVARGVIQASAARRSLAEWSLPSDLTAHLPNLQDLRLPRSVTRLDWLPEGLRRLDASGVSVHRIEGLPASLASLDISRAPIERTGQLPASLESLDLSWTGIARVEDLPHNLQSLRLAGEAGSFEPKIRIELKALPRTLRHLTLDGVEYDSLAGLPPALTSLTLIGTKIRNLEGLPPSIQSLELINNDVLDIDIDSLPPTLMRLTVEGNSLPDLRELHYLSELDISRGGFKGSDQLPASLEVLRLNGQALEEKKEEAEKRNEKFDDLRRLPPSLKSLGLIGSDLDDDLTFLPSTLKVLDLSWFPGSRLPKLPPSLRELNLSWSALETLDGLPKDLESLDISATPLTRLEPWTQSLTNLKSLTFRWAKVEKVPKLPATLQSLDLTGAQKIQALDEFENLEHLDISQTGIKSVDRLPRSLKSLNISNTPIKDLRGLPPRLESLTLSAGQVERLGSLPPTLHKIYFVDAIAQP